MPSAFEQGLPNRHLPLSVQSAVLFGGFANQFGWLFFGFGMVFVTLFTLNADFRSVLAFRGELQMADGTVVECEPTRFSEDDSKTYAVTYTFTADGKHCEGTSYCTGHEMKVDSRVKVEYVKGRPSTSRVKGLDSSPVPFWAGSA